VRLASGDVRVMTTVLIVEDESQVRVFAESYLRRHGHRTISAASEKQALALLDAGEGVDVLFAEIELQGDGLAGVRLARQAARRRPGMKVLYASDHHVTDGLKPLLVVPSEVLEKPYTVDELEAGVTGKVAAVPRRGD
jgi:DNA-binding NtrC family response regulator